MSWYTTVIPIQGSRNGPWRWNLFPLAAVKTIVMLTHTPNCFHKKRKQKHQRNESNSSTKSQSLVQTDWAAWFNSQLSPLLSRSTFISSAFSPQWAPSYSLSASACSPQCWMAWGHSISILARSKWVVEVGADQVGGGGGGGGLGTHMY